MFFVLRTSVWIKDERRLIHMKDFFENFGKRFGETAEMVTNKAGEMIEIQRVKS
ncbi:zinc ribbon domain-containing protein, partial [Enterocloster bolteae]|nr:zinc ribbon domain-containing protein [Enterocloster bolteae]